MKKKILSLVIAGLLPVSYSHTLYAETTISGSIEAEANFTEDEDDTGVTVEVGLDHKVSDKVDGHLLLKYEQDDEDDDVYVDEAVINLHPTDSMDIVVGRQYVPFGRFDTNMISDPITLDLGETREEAALITQKFGGFGASAYVFKDKADGANDKIDNYGVDFAYENEQFSAGVGYISDVADTTVEGINVHAKLSLGKASIIAEHMRLDDIAGVNPNASHLEFAFDLGNDKVIAATYQESSDASVLDLPKEVVGISYSMPVYKNTSVAAEYLNSTDYDDEDSDVINLKLTYEF
ncbi:hypothetical protein GCM10009133_26340 [Cocleimonas flava]|uniref:Porin-like protein n=1 Tax=Cocleimonas flava TaxID=634765 RepID=A0A4R1EVL1_9GAMM|nr:LbtU family siderophore porin [Cocleimonas flava]TCJ83168.1 porin-like protein [Cocleimonas flava]